MSILYVAEDNGTIDQIDSSARIFTAFNDTSTLVVFDDQVADFETLNRALLPGSFAERGLCPIGFTIDRPNTRESITYGTLRDRSFRQDTKMLLNTDRSNLKH